MTYIYRLWFWVFWVFWVFWLLLDIFGVFRWRIRLILMLVIRFVQYSWTWPIEWGYPRVNRLRYFVETMEDEWWASFFVCQSSFLVILSILRHTEQDRRPGLSGEAERRRQTMMDSFPGNTTEQMMVYCSFTHLFCVIQIQFKQWWEVVTALNARSSAAEIGFPPRTSGDVPPTYPLQWIGIFRSSQPFGHIQRLC